MGGIGGIIRSIFGGGRPERTEERPCFRFHPGAYGRSFEASDEPCGICGRACNWRYTGNLYVAGAAPVVCAWCIADGSLPRHFKGRPYAFSDAELNDVSPALEAEVLQRTPGFATFNPFTWPVLDGKPLAFVGYGDEPGIWADPDARAAITEGLAEMFGPEDPPGPSAYALVFRQLEGPRHVAVVDLD